jgi:hypothetical protein
MLLAFLIIRTLVCHVRTGWTMEQTGGVPIAEAAAQLGLKPAAVHKRVQRGKLPAYRAADGTRRVVLNGRGPARTTRVDNGWTAEDSAGTSGGTTGVIPPDYLLTHLQQEVAFLRTQVERHQEAERELRVLLAQQTRRPASSTTGATSITSVIGTEA